MLSLIRTASRCRSEGLLHHNLSKLRIINMKCLSSHNHEDLDSPQRPTYTMPSPEKEISIPIPYGQLAAKAWGRENGHPVIALHGIMDNCGTFDRLIPLLDKSLYIIALDLPGHGFSSHKPTGCCYGFADMFIAIQYVVKHFQWPKFNIIGHSMGGQIAQLFTGLYPELVEKLVILDIIKPFSLPSKDIPTAMVKAFEENLALEEKLCGTAPVYTTEAAAKRLADGLHNEVTEELAHYILKRGTKLSECGNGQVFTRDLRLRSMIPNSEFSDEVIRETLSRIKSEMLLIRASNTHPAYISRTLDFDMTFLDLYRKHCKSFSFETVPGNHYLHLNDPKSIAPLINKFIVNFQNI